METKRIKLVDVNPYLMCTLCSGYIIDAMTIIECLHSFCKTCIYQYLESNKYCPVCDVQVHKTKPLLNVRPDKTFQALIYKIVPGLSKNEIERRRLFYSLNPEPGVNPTPVNVLDQLTAEYPSTVLSPTSETHPEWISLCLELSDRLPPLAKIVAHGQRCIRANGGPIKDQRHLLCPVGLTVGHLKKFLRGKFDLCTELRVDVYHSDEILKDVYSLGDIASIYTWRRTEPMKLYYVVYKMVESTAVSFDVDMKVNNEKVICDLDAPSSTVAKSLSEPDSSAKTCAVLPNNDTGSTAVKQKKALLKASDDVISASTASESAANSMSSICPESKTSLQEGEISAGSDGSTNDDKKDERGKELKVFAPAFLLLKHDLSLCRSGAPSIETNASECKQIDCPIVFTTDQSNAVNTDDFDKMQDVGRISEMGNVTERGLCGFDSTDSESVIAANVLLSKATALDNQPCEECVSRVPSEEKCGFEPQLLLLSDVENQDQTGKKENRPAKKRSSEIEQLFLDRNATREVRNLYKELALSSDKRGRSAHLRLRLRPGSVIRRRSIGLNSSRSGKVRGAVASKSYTVRQKLAESNKRK